MNVCDTKAGLELISQSYGKCKEGGEILSEISECKEETEISECEEEGEISECKEEGEISEGSEEDESDIDSIIDLLMEPLTSRHALVIYVGTFYVFCMHTLGCALSGSEHLVCRPPVSTSFAMLIGYSVRILETYF